MNIVNPSSAVCYESCQFSTGPGIVMTPTTPSLDDGTIFLYHGWGSTIIRQLFRGQILASWGYRVIIPELLHHGARGELTYEDAKVALSHFWEVVENSISEFPVLKQEAVTHWGVNPGKIAVLGHSMGGFIVTGLMGRYPEIAAGVGFNAGTDWTVMNRKMAALLDTTLEALESQCTYDGCVICHNQMNPLNAFENYCGRPLLLTNGGKDETVPPEGNHAFVERMSSEYPKADWFSYIFYEEVGHHVTDGMLYDGLSFVKRFL